MKYSPEIIKELKPNEIFVFGSNLSGHHKSGAAKAAMEKFGAVWGIGSGLQGQSYAIPTTSGNIETIKTYVDKFIEFAKANKNLTFLVTRIGCGHVGFKDEDIAPLFQEALGVSNILLPKSFADLIEPEFTFDPKRVEDAVNWVLPGLTLLYRDTDHFGDLDEIARFYKRKNIIRAGFFIDCTPLVTKPLKRIRFVIASSHSAPLWSALGDEKLSRWYMHVLDYNSYFKVMDTFRIGDRLQILLLHIPMNAMDIFAGMQNINIDGETDLVSWTRKHFEDPSELKTIPSLLEEEWAERTYMLPGTNALGWAELDPVLPPNEEVANLHYAILDIINDRTDMNK